MPEISEKLKFIEDLAERLDTKKYADELMEKVNLAVEIFVAMKKANEAEKKNLQFIFDQKMVEIEKDFAELQNRHDSDVEDIRSEALDYCKTEISKLRKEQENDLNFLRDKGRNLKDGYTPIKGVDYFDGEPGKNADEITSDQILNKVQERKEGDRWEIRDVNGLRDELDEIRKLKGSSKNMGGVIGRDLIKDIDLSDQLDGVTKTFNIPAVWNIISVQLSSFPHALRKTVDFTYTGTSITFTSQIDASTSLASGQTCVLTVVSG